MNLSNLWGFICIFRQNSSFHQFGMVIAYLINHKVGDEMLTMRQLKI